MFRFAYSKEFLRWALQVCPPAWLGWRSPSGTAQQLWQTHCLAPNHQLCGAEMPVPLLLLPSCKPLPTPPPLVQPPGFRAEWHCGVRVSTTGKLVAFISGIPATVRVNSSSLKTVRGWR